MKQISNCSGNIRVLNRHKRMSILCSTSITLTKKQQWITRSSWFLLLFCYFIILESSYQTLLKIATKKSNYQKREDYTFEGMLNKAKDECAFMQNVNNTVNRNKTIQMIKEKIINKRLKEFYEKQEKERQLAKEYYESVKFQMKRRLLQGESPEWGPKFGPPGPASSLPHHPLHKRSTDSKGRRRKGSNPFSGVTFTDHNNCSGRCVFSMMDMVNTQGFPEESLIIKLIDDKIPNRKVRLGKMKKVINCFKNIEKATKSLPNGVESNFLPLDVSGAFSVNEISGRVPLDDSCIFSARVFECLDLDESTLWTSKK